MQIAVRFESLHSVGNRRSRATSSLRSEGNICSILKMPVMQEGFTPLHCLRAGMPSSSTLPLTVFGGTRGYSHAGLTSSSSSVLLRRRRRRRRLFFERRRAFVLLLAFPRRRRRRRRRLPFFERRRVFLMLDPSVSHSLTILRHFSKERTALNTLAACWPCMFGVRQLGKSLPLYRQATTL